MQNGSISNVEEYARRADVNVNYATILRKLKIITRIPKTHSYTWRLREPDSSMVIRVMDAMTDYNRGIREFRVRVLPNPSEQKPTRNIQVSSVVSKLNLLDFLYAYENFTDLNDSKENRVEKAKDLIHWKNS